MQTGYPIGRHTGVCAATDQPLPPGTPCVVTLCEEEDGDGLVRLEFSVEAWEGGALPDRLFSWWRTITPESDAPAHALVDDEVLLTAATRVDRFESIVETVHSLHSYELPAVTAVALDGSSEEP